MEHARQGSARVHSRPVSSGPQPQLEAGITQSGASDMGFRWEITRGFALIGRELGALAHIQEEMDEPISDELIRNVQKSVEYDA